VYNVTSNNILVISWWAVELLEETRVPEVNRWPAKSHKIVLNTPHNKELEIKNVPEEEIKDKLVNDYLEVGHL
jgi:hypothetical protein